MKKSKKQTKQNLKTVACEGMQPVGCVAPPPWTKCSTKEIAWKGGYNEGLIENSRRTKEEYLIKETNTRSEERKTLLEALKHICQSGANCTDAMSKAFLSFNNHL